MHGITAKGRPRVLVKVMQIELGVDIRDCRLSLAVIVEGAFVVYVDVYVNVPHSAVLVYRLDVRAFARRELSHFDRPLVEGDAELEADGLGDEAAVMMPVPRKLSASCGTCVRFELPFDPAWADEDLAGVYVREGSGFRAIFLNQSED